MNYTISSSWDQNETSAQRIRKRNSDKINRSWVPASCRTFVWSRYFLLSEKWKAIPGTIFLAWREIFNSLNFENHQSERLHICSGIFKRNKVFLFFNKNLHHLTMWNNRYGTKKGALQLIPEVEVQRIKSQRFKDFHSVQDPWPLLIA